MLILISAILTLGGIGERELRSAGLNKKHIIFFLICVFFLNSYSICPTDDIEISAGCVFIAVWLYGNAFGEKGIKPFLALPFSLIIGALSSIVAILLKEALEPFMIISCMLLTVLFGIYFGSACAGLVPVFSYASVYTFFVLRGEYETLSITESCLTMQLLCLIISMTFFFIFLNSTYVRRKSYGRTTP